MKKHSFLGRFLSMLTALTMLLGMVGIPAFAVNDTWDQSYLVSQAVKANGAPVSAIGDSIEYTMLTGDFFGDGVLSQFTTMGDSVLGSGSEPVCVQPWQIKVTGGSDFVMKITAKQNLYMNLWQNADTISDWVGNTQISYVVENAKGTRVTLKTLNVEVDVPITTAQYDTHLHLKAGDTAYIIYHKTDEHSATYASNMRITVDTEAFDASQRTYFPATTTVLAHTDMVSAQVAAGGAPVDAENVTYQYLYGDVAGQLNAFTEFSGNGSGGTNDIVGNANGDNAVWRWQWRAGDVYDTVLKITATEDLKLSLSHPSVVPEGEIWAFHSAFTLYTANQYGTLVQLAEYAVEAPMNTAGIDDVIHMAAGDSIYLVYGLTGSGNGQVTAGLLPIFTADPEAYDASERTEFPSVTTVLAHTDMVSAQVAAGGKPVAEENVTYQYLYGDLEAGQLNAFTSFSGDGSGGTNDIVGNANGDNAVWRWQWRAGDAYDTLLKITATKDLKLSLSHPSIVPEGEIWAFHSTFLLYTADEAGHLVQLAEYPVESPMNTAGIDDVIHMAAGDSIYLVYGLKGSGNGQVTAGLLPIFTADPEAYDASLRTVFVTEPNVLQHPDMVSAEVAAKGASVTAASVTYQYLYGDVEKGQLNAFTTFAGNGSGGADDAVGDVDGNNAVQRWQWRAGEAYDTVLRITATENLKLDLSNPSGVPEASIWAFHSRFLLYAQNTVGTLKELAEYPVKTLVNANSINTSIHMAAGDSIYIVYAMDSGHTGIVVNEFMPWFTVCQKDYDPALRTDFGNEDPVGYVENWGLMLQDSIGVNFDMCVRTQTADVVVTVDGAETVFSDVKDGQHIRVALAAAQMTDTISVQLVDKNGNESQVYRYSVRQYADTILAGDYDDTTKALVKAMLRYGGKAQLFFNHNTENLADAGIAVEQLKVPAEYPDVTVEGKAANVSFYGASLLFRDRTAVRLYFRVDGNVAAHTFTSGVRTYVPVWKDGMYYIEIDGISPADLDESYSVTVDGTLTVSYSPRDYILRMYNQKDSSQTLKDVVCAMYTYLHAAEAYLLEHNQSNLYGICYIAYEGMGNGIHYKPAFELMSNLGVKSIRHWMHMTWFIDEDFNVIEENVALMKEIIAEAEKYDIQLIGMSHRNINKYGPAHENSKIGRDSAYYAEWIANYERGWYMLADLFPEITVWEIDNETNNQDFMVDAEGGTFTAREMADISTDMFYYGSRGIHRANPYATTVMGGFVTWDEGAFLKQVYENIKSGKFGEGSTNPDDYFQALAWHPYMVVFDAEEFIQLNQKLYDIACSYEGKTKTVYFTELGGWDEFLTQEQSAQYLTQLYTEVAGQLPFVETMHYFRAFDNIVDNGNQFGMFADPNPEREDICNGERLTPGMPKLTAYAYQAAAGGEGSLELLCSEENF